MGYDKGVAPVSFQLNGTIGAVGEEDFDTRVFVHVHLLFCAVGVGDFDKDPRTGDVELGSSPQLLMRAEEEGKEKGEAEDDMSFHELLVLVCKITIKT